MPGLYGVVNSESASSNLESMTKSMYLYNHLIQDELFCDGIIAASRVSTGKVGELTSPVKLDSYAIWIEGEAYNVPNVASDLGLEALTFSDLLLAAEQSGQLNQCLNKIDGYFCAALYNSESKKLKLMSDRYGMRLLYWYHKDGMMAWGSEVKAILAVNNVNKKLDSTSFECFMELGYLMGEHTWFEYIQLIKPASVIEYDLASDKAYQYHYWKWSEIEPSNMSFDEAANKLGKCFIQAVAKRFNPNEQIGISLSGGLDSRAIFAAVDHLHPDYNGYAYTFGITGCDDSTIAEQVISCSKKWQHENFYFSADNWFQPRIEKVWATDGMLDMMQMHGSEFLPNIVNHIEVNLNGYAGDTIFGGGFLTNVPLNQRISDDNSRAFYGRFSHLTDIDNDFYDIECVEPHLYMNRVRRFTIYGSVNALSWIDQRKPFFDNRVVELIFSLPDDYRANNRLYSAMLQNFFPKYFRSIPWQKTGKPAGVIKKASIPTRAVRKGVRIFKQLTGIKSTLGYTDYPNWIRNKKVSEQLREVLDPKTARYTMLTEDRLAKLWLEPHLSDDSVDHSNQILRAATIEIYLRKVFG